MISLIGRPYCQKVLPLVYDESLSYLEQICKLRHKINEVIDEFNQWESIILELQDALQDISGMKSDISTLKSDVVNINQRMLEITTVIDSLDSYVKNMEKQFDKRLTEDEESLANLVKSISKLRTDVFTAIDNLRTELVDLFNSFTVDFTEELEMLQLKVNQMKVNFQNQIDELRQIVEQIDTSVINPWHWELGKISQQKNVELTYRDLADNVPLAKEYCMESLTAQEYTNLGLTALDYVTRARKLLHLDWVFSPTYGWRQEINNVLTSIVTWLSDTMSANVYAEMELDADGYSALNLSAQDYYKFKPENVGLYVEDGVLQSQQYTLVEVDGVLQVFGGTTTETDGVLTVE